MSRARRTRIASHTHLCHFFFGALGGSPSCLSDSPFSSFLCGSDGISPSVTLPSLFSSPIRCLLDWPVDVQTQFDLWLHPAPHRVDHHGAKKFRELMQEWSA